MLANNFFDNSLSSCVKSIFSIETASSFLELGTAISISYLAIDQNDAGKSGLTFSLIAQVLTIVFSSSRHLDSLGIVWEADAKDDALHPYFKANKEGVIRGTSFAREAVSTITYLSLVGLFPNIPQLNKASTILAPISAATERLLASVYADFLSEADRVNGLREEVKPVYQPVAVGPGEPLLEVVPSTAWYRQVFTARNGAIFLLSWGNIVLSALATNQNDRSTEKFVTLSLLAKIMNMGFGFANLGHAGASIKSAHEADDRINPNVKPVKTARQSKFLAATCVSAVGMVLSEIGLFAGTKEIAVASAVLAPVFGTTTLGSANAYANDVVENSRRRRPGMGGGENA